MRHLVSTAIVALVVSALTVTTVGVLAQEPTQVTPAATVSNADRVDGKHAVGAGTTRAARAGKLVATDASGYLPANIVKNLVTRVALTTVSDSMAAEGGVGATGSIQVACPPGARAVGGGFFQSGYSVVFTDSSSYGTGWLVYWRKTVDEAVTVYVQATCMSVTPSAALVVARDGLRPARKR
jgi:hypothetical protein